MRRLAGVVAGALALATMSAVVLAPPARAAAPTFTPTVVDTLPSYSPDMDIVDLDADGSRDIVTLDYNSSALLVYRGGASGYTKVSYPLACCNQNLDVGDADNDGDLDVVTADVINFKVTLFTNDGSGALAASDITPVGSTSGDVKFANVAGDAVNEVVVANYFGNNVEILSRQAGGTYTSSAKPTTGYTTNAVEVSDLDGDGDQDLAAANRDSTGLTIQLKNAGAGYTRTDVAVSGSADDVDAANLDGDARPELVVRTQQGGLTVVDVAADGTTSTLTVPVASSNTADVELVNIDADPALEIVGASYKNIDVYEFQSGAYVLAGSSPIAPIQGQQFNPSTLAAGDLDGDTDVDLASATFGGSSTYRIVTLSNTALTPANQPPVINEASPSITTPQGTAGSVNLTASDPDGGTLTWSITVQGTKGTATVPAGAGTSMTITYTPSAGAIGADSFTVQVADGQGGTDTVVVSVTITGPPAPAPTFTATTIDTNPSPSNDLATTNLNGDAFTDIVGLDYNTSALLVYLGGASSYTRVSYPLACCYQNLDVGDADNDGDLDVVAADVINFKVMLFTNNGTGALTASDITPSGATAADVKFADLAGDAVNEIVVANYFGNNVEILSRGVGGVYTSLAKPTTGYTTNGVAVGDLDGDGDLDLAAANRDSTGLTIQLKNAGAGYTRTDVSVSGSADDVDVANLDGDARPELVVRTQQGGLTVVDVAADGSTSALVVPVGGNGPQDVAISDIDADGVLEIVAGRFQGIDVYEFSGGAYVPSTTSPVAPISGQSFNPSAIAAGDLDGDGDVDLAASTFAGSGSYRTVILINGAAAPVNQPPVIAPETPSITTAQGTPGSVNLTASDPDGDALTWSIAVQGTKGTATVPAGAGTSKTVTYTPNAGATGTDSFTVQVSDGKGGTDTVVVSVTITASPSDTVAPTTTDDVPAGVVTTPVTVTLTAADDPGGSGVAAIRYTIGTAANPPADPTLPGASVYSATSKPVLTDGQRIRYSAVDGAGNAEAPKTSGAAQVTTTVSKPTIKGVVQVGKTLTATTPTVTPTGATIAYRWYSAAPGGTYSLVPGATASTYTVKAADAGKRFVVLVAAVAEGYRTGVNASDPSAVVASTPIATYTVKAVGGTRVGTVRVAQTSLDSDDTVDLDYQWQRAGSGGAWVDLPGVAATRRSYELPPAVQKVNVRVLVTARRGTSTKAIASAPLLILPGNHNASDPRITGVRKVGERLRAVITDTDKPDDLKLTYLWTVAGTRIRLTGKTITLPPGAAGKKIFFDVRLTAPGYHNQELRSAQVLVRP